MLISPSPSLLVIGNTDVSQNHDSYWTFKELHAILLVFSLSLCACACVYVNMCVYVHMCVCLYTCVAACVPACGYMYTMCATAWVDGDSPAVYHSSCAAHLLFLRRVSH